MSAPNRDFGRPRRRLCGSDRALCLGRKLRHRQYLLAQYAGLAQPAAGDGARRSARAASSMRARRVAPNAGPTPVLLKIGSLDLSLAELDDVVGIARSRRVEWHDRRQHDARASAEPAGNQARTRGGRIVRQSAVRARNPYAGRETCVQGGRRVPAHRRAGGIDSRPGLARLAKVLGAGATLLQLYSALVFRGIGLVADIKSATGRRARAPALRQPRAN